MDVGVVAGDGTLDGADRVETGEKTPSTGITFVPAGGALTVARLLVGDDVDGPGSLLTLPTWERRAGLASSSNVITGASLDSFGVGCIFDGRCFIETSPLAGELASRLAELTCALGL